MINSSVRLALALLTFAPCTSVALAAGGAAGHWTLDERGGAVVHDSAGSRDGSVAGGATFVATGVAGGSMTFTSASGALVDFGDVPEFDFTTADFSVSLWMKLPRGATGDDYPISNHFAGIPNGWILFTGVSGGCYGDPAKPTFYYSDNCPNELTAPVSVNDGTWHHIVCSCRSGISRSIFIDGGVADAQGSAAIGTVHLNSRFIIGGITSNGAASAGFDGALDDVQIYNRALSCAEANYLFQHPGAEVSNVADLDGNGAVNAADLAILLGAWGACGAGPCSADFDCSGTVDASDLAVLLGGWTG